MRRLIATIAVMGALIWAYQTGYSARRTLDNVAHAQGETTAPDRIFTEIEQVPNVYPPRSEPVSADENPVRLGEDSVFQVGSSEEVKRVLNAKPAENRFNRGTLNESFDGEIIRGRRVESGLKSVEEEPISLSDPVSAEATAPPALEASDEFAQANAGDVLDDAAGPGFPGPVRRKGQLIPVQPNPTPSFSDPHTATGKLIAGSTRRVPPTPPRVMLMIGKDHQISVRPESRIPAESHKEMPAGSIIVIAEEFGLVPPTEPAAGNQVTCTGNVQLISQNVAATCTKLTFKGNSLVLEGTAQHRVEVTRQAAGDAAAFQLSADKISFTLSLDKIEIGGGVTVSPAASPATEPVISPDPRLPPAPSVPIKTRPAMPPEDLAPAPASVPNRNFGDDDAAPPTEGDAPKTPLPDFVPPVAPEAPKP